jgi:hypothetical protein
MDISQRDKIFGILCSISDQQFDASAKRRLAAMIGRPNEDIKDELLGLVDDCVYYAWSGGFEIATLRFLWEDIGGSPEELAARNAALKEPARREELKNKYKWQR